MTKILPTNKLTIAFLALFFLALAPMQMIAQKKVLYVQRSSYAPATGASAANNDPYTRMLTDTGFIVTTISTDANGTTPPISYTGYDLVIVQETFGSGDAALKPAGPLAIKNFTIPVIYNKTFALRTTRAVTSAAAAITSNTIVPSLTVDPAKKSHPIFNGITFSGNDFPVFTGFSTYTTDVINGLEISATNTLLATVGTTVTDVTKAVLINDFPAGTQLGTAATDVLPSRMITFAFGYVPSVAGDGKNITSEHLTLWRNAAFILTGQTVPTTLYVNPSLGVNENTLADNSVSITPNPTSGIVTVNSTADVKSITVFDATGKQVSASKTNTVDLSSQASGMYLLNVQTENGSATKKVVVE